jgi:hypothetical protein
MANEEQLYEQTKHYHKLDIGLSKLYMRHPHLIALAPRFDR